MTDRSARYARQLVLPGWGPRAQAAIEDARVLVVGAGGLGSPTLLYLAAAGVGAGQGCIGVVDADTVDESNLHRQVIHGSADAGRPKTDSALDALHRLDPDAHVRAHAVRLDATNAEEIIGGYDLVVDGSDNFPTRYLVNDTCARLRVPLVWGAVQAFGGQLGVAAPGHACYRCVFPEPPAAGAVPSCAQIGVLGSVCASVAALQCTEAFKVLAGVGAPATDRVLVHDALAMTWEEVPVARRPGCVCSGVSQAATEPQTAVEACSAVPAIDSIAPLDLAPLVRSGAVQVVDVRSAAERAVVAIPGSRHLPLDDLFAGAPLPERGDVVLVCRSGVRSRAAAEELGRRGVTVRDLDGGMLAWVRDVVEWPLDATSDPTADTPLDTALDTPLDTVEVAR